MSETKQAPLAPPGTPWSIIAGSIARVLTDRMRPLLEHMMERLDEIAGTKSKPLPTFEDDNKPIGPVGHAEFLIDLFRKEFNPHPSRPFVGAEIGVWDGATSSKLLAAFPPDAADEGGLFLYMFDTWGSKPPTEAYLRTGDPLPYQPPQVFAEIKRQATERVAPFGRRYSIQQRLSTDIPIMITDGLLDFAFIDADHSLPAVRADIAAWWPKIRSGGILCGHDYLTEEESLSFHCSFGVIEAVDEFVAREGLSLNVDKGSSVWWVRKA